MIRRSGLRRLRTDHRYVSSWVPSPVHTNGGRIFAQIMHGGRVGHPEVVGYLPVGPSAVALNGQLYTGPKGMLPTPVPRALATSEIKGEIQAYADAARRAIDAGFDGVELHGVNGYLISQFLSANANQRSDAYGGSIAGRTRFAVEVAEATADAIGAERVSIRLSPGGTVWDIVEHDVPQLYEALMNALAPLGLSYVHTLGIAADDVLVGLRKAWPGTFIINPSPQLGGTLVNRERADRWLGLGADLISFGRAYLANPDLVERLRLGLPRREHDPATMYAGETAGYLEYTSYQH